MRGGGLVVDELEERAPLAGQVSVEVLACGICGSDLHALHHADQMVEMSSVMAADVGPLAPKVMDPAHDVVMGHEFAARVLEVGENVGNCRPGDVVVSMPVVLDPGGVHAIGYSNDYPGGYAERMVLSDVLCLKVPDGVDPRRAALTEPMAVGLHAVNLSRLTERDSAVVLGCGPVGLAVIAACAAMGVESLVAADFSPTRRALAAALGATEVVDPSTEPAMEAWRRVDGMLTNFHLPRSSGGVGSSCSRRSGCPACWTRRSPRRRASPRSWSWACAWSPTRSGRWWRSARR